MTVSSMNEEIHAVSPPAASLLLCTWIVVDYVLQEGVAVKFQGGDKFVQVYVRHCDCSCGDPFSSEPSFALFSRDWL